MTAKPEVREKFSSNGRLMEREFWMDGELHRDDGPAVEVWDSQGHLIYRTFWVNGEVHNTTGPAVEVWHSNGCLDDSEFYVNGEELTEAEFIAWLERQQRQRELRALVFALEHKFPAEAPEREFLRHILPAHVAGDAAPCELNDKPKMT